jgi:hypothetical protein
MENLDLLERERNRLMWEAERVAERVVQVQP